MNAQTQVLRVAQLVETLEAGGAEALAVDIAGALAARGHQSHLIVANSAGPFRRRVDARVRFHDLDRPRRDGSQAFRIAYFLETCRRLECLLRTQRVDVLQTHLPKANFLGLAMAWRGVCRVHPTIHNNREFDYGDGAGAAKQRLRRDAYRAMVRSCADVIAVSSQVRASLAGQLNLGPHASGRIRVVENGVTVPAASALSGREEARRRWSVADDQVFIVGVGRLTRQKNFSALVDALQGLSPTCGDWRCVIAGNGELREDLIAQIDRSGLNGRVTLTGLVDDVDGLLRAADVFCLPSLYEGLPLVLLEAMARGLPVVAFGIAGVVDVVADGIHARVAAPHDLEGLTAALADLVSDPIKRIRLGGAGRRLIAERFNFETTVDNLETIYRSDRRAKNGTAASC